MRIKWLGHSCFCLEGSKKIIIDPFMPHGDFGCTPDIVAVTHGHGDHFGDAMKFKKPVVCPNEIARYLSARSLDAEPLNIGGTIVRDGVSFTMVPALHSSLLQVEGEELYGGPASGFVIRMDGVTVYHAGDTGLFSDMKLIRDLYHPDVAMLPIGGRFTMGPSEAMMAAGFIGAPIVIPMHYNTSPLVEQDAGEFKRSIEEVTPMKVVVMEPGEEIETDDYKAV